MSGVPTDYLVNGHSTFYCESLQGGPAKPFSTDFQKLNLALSAILISRAVLLMMCSHEKNQQAPFLEVVGPYGEYCQIRQLGGPN